MQQDAREQLAQANSNELQQAWPELNAADEKQLKQAVEKVLDQINEFQGNVDDLVKESPEITRMLSEAADEFVDKALRDVTATVSDARESGGANLDQTLQRLDDVSNRIEGAQNRLDQDVREAPEASRQSLLEDASRSQDEMKKSLWEMNGYELEKSQMADFRRDAGLPNEGLVTRPEEGELFGANVSMKKLIDNIEEFANVERAGKEQNQAESGSNHRASSEEQWESLRAADQAALGERWEDLTPAAEQRLKDAFRDVGEQADTTRDAINEVIDKQGGGSQRLDQMLNQVEEEMNNARKAVTDVLQNADEQNNKVPKSVMEQLDKAEDRLAGLERQLDKVAGEKVRDVLEPSGLTEALDQYRDQLAAEVDWKKAEADRAQANRETNPGGHDLAREELRAAQDELKELDDLLNRRISGMRPDLAEVRLPQDPGEGGMRIDMTDFTHRVDSITHTAKAHAYKEAMQQAFPGADVSMFEYRSPTHNNHLGEAEEFAEALKHEVEKREAAIEARQREIVLEEEEKKRRRSSRG
jgi:ABC-type transporter Mla subunit MlaD